MTAEQYKKKLIAYLEHNIKLCKANESVEFESCKDSINKEDMANGIKCLCLKVGARQRQTQLQNLIADIKDGTIENIMEE